MLLAALEIRPILVCIANVNVPAANTVKRAENDRFQAHVFAEFLHSQKLETSVERDLDRVTEVEPESNPARK